MRMDWSTRRVVDFIEVTLMSAGTLSPTKRKILRDLKSNVQKQEALLGYI